MRQFDVGTRHLRIDLDVAARQENAVHRSWDVEDGLANSESVTIPTLSDSALAPADCHQVICKAKADGPR